MSELVQIPWQRTLWLTPKTLDRLIDAVGILHRQIYLNDADAAWRSYDRQEALFIAAGRNPLKANDPDRGQRAHMKGAGLDVPTDKVTRDAMLAAGFKPDANELWHFNDPDVAFMPIIKVNTAAAGSGSTPILEDDMPDMNTFLNTPAFDGGPTISEMFKRLAEIDNALFVGGPALPGGTSIPKLIDGIPARVWASPVIRAGVPVSAIQELADAKTILIRVEAAIKALPQK